LTIPAIPVILATITTTATAVIRAAVQTASSVPIYGFG